MDEKKTMRALALAVGLLGLPQSAAAAEDDPVVLTWSVPQAGGCPDQSYAVNEVRRYVGPARPERGPVIASVVVSAAGPGEWQLLLRTEQAGARGERRLRDASCAALVDATIVVLAWMVDPERMAARAPDRPRAAQAAPQKPVAPALPRSVRAAKARSELRSFVGVAAPIDVGTLPGTALGAEGHIGLSLRPVSWAAYASYWPQSTRTLGVQANGAAYGGRFELWALGAQSCFAPSLAGSRVTLAACAGPELDILHGESFGITSPGGGGKAWVSAVLELAAHATLVRHLALTARVSGVVHSRRENFSVHGLGVVHQPGPAALRTALGLELQL